MNGAVQAGVEYVKTDAREWIGGPLRLITGRAGDPGDFFQKPWGRRLGRVLGVALLPVGVYCMGFYSACAALATGAVALREAAGKPAPAPLRRMPIIGHVAKAWDSISPRTRMGAVGLTLGLGASAGLMAGVALASWSWTAIWLGVAAWWSIRDAYPAIKQRTAALRQARVAAPGRGAAAEPELGLAGHQVGVGGAEVAGPSIRRSEPVLRERAASRSAVGAGRGSSVRTSPWSDGVG